MVTLRGVHAHRHAQVVVCSVSGHGCHIIVRSAACHSCHSPNFTTDSPSLFLLRATREGAALARRMEALATYNGWPSADGAAWAAGVEESVD